MLLPPSYTIFPLGDSALTVDFGNVINESINSRVLQLFQQLKKCSLPYITDIVPAYSSLTIHYTTASLPESRYGTTFQTIVNMIEDTLHHPEEGSLSKKRILKIPVCYTGTYALDIQEIAAQRGLSAENIIQLHTSKSYRVYMIGFLPGFAYMGEVDERLAMPRKAQPRSTVEKGSVGIAGRQTGIYPVTSPGGWQIIGRTPVPLFNKEETHPVWAEPGDEVIFYSITEDEFAHYQTRHT